MEKFPHIGQKIKELKEQKGISNKEFSMLIGTTENNLFSVYRRADTTTDIIKRVMSATGVKSAYFFGETAVYDIDQTGKINVAGENPSLYIKENQVAKTSSIDTEKDGFWKKLLEAKDNEISTLKQMVELLKSLKNVS